MAQKWLPNLRTFSTIFFDWKSGSANIFAFRMYECLLFLLSKKEKLGCWLAEVVLCADKISLALNGWTISFPSLGNLTYMQQIADRGGGSVGQKWLRNIWTDPYWGSDFSGRFVRGFLPIFQKALKKSAVFSRKVVGWRSDLAIPLRAHLLGQKPERARCYKTFMLR